MSHDIIRYARARVDDRGGLVLEVKAHCNNIRPYPRLDELRRRDFEPLSGCPLPLADNEAVACYLESLARDYEGRCIRENFRDIPGVAAYNLWRTRIRRVVPNYLLRPPRRSKLVWGFGAELAEVRPVPGLPLATALTAELATELVSAQVYPLVRSPLLRDTKTYLAFVKDGRIVIGKRPGAGRGWPVPEAFLDEPVVARTARPAIEPADDGDYAIRMEGAEEAPRILCRDLDVRTFDAITKANFKLYTPAYFTESNANAACERLTRGYPEVNWSVMPRADAERELSAAAPVTQPT